MKIYTMVSCTRALGSARAHTQEMRDFKNGSMKTLDWTDEKI